MSAKPSPTEATPRRPARRPGRFRTLALIALAIPAASTAWVLWQGDPTVWFDARAARRLIEAGRPREAEAPLARWLKARPGAAEPHYYRGLALLGLGRPQEALAALDRARGLGFPEAIMGRTFGLISARAGRLDQAESYLRAALDAAKRPDPELDAALARVYLETFRFAPALKVIERWARDAPADPRPWMFRVEALERIGTPAEEVAAAYREALKRDPELHAARLGLAGTLARLDRRDEAAAEYTRYLRARPDDAAALLGAGQNALEAGRDEEAIAVLDRALAVEPKPGDVAAREARAAALDARATLALRRRDAEAALALIDRAVADDPENPEYHHHRGLALAQLGRAAEARAASGEAARLRADLKAMDELRKALVRAPNDRALQVRAARWLLDHGHADEGLRWAHRAADTPPGSPAAARLLADHYAAHDNPGLANYYRLQAGPVGGD